MGGNQSSTCHGMSLHEAGTRSVEGERGRGGEERKEKELSHQGEERKKIDL